MSNLLEIMRYDYAISLSQLKVVTYMEIHVHSTLAFHLLFLSIQTALQHFQFPLQFLYLRSVVCLLLQLYMYIQTTQ